MRTLALSALTVSLAVALLVGCGGTQTTIGVPGAQSHASALVARTSSTNYKVLYSFGAPPDGNRPQASLIDVGGTLYGTTEYGGAYHDDGTVFSITPSGTEKVLYSFAGTPDGNRPEASVIDVGGTLYGTTYGGGAYDSGFECGGGRGTVFSMTPSGAEKVLYSFGLDGAYPHADLIDVNGTLYGTTELGGPYCAYNGGCGTVYNITTQGEEKALYSFRPHHDGVSPEAGLINVKGKLYGTTLVGDAGHRRGTVFSVTQSGKEKVLYSFRKFPDASRPVASLIDVGGTLYGTTATGGAYSCDSQGRCGTVFSITRGGTEKVLHNFGNGSDGGQPTASLIDVNGTLYGTTQYGGTNGHGTVFSITTSGTEQVLHNFGGSSSDGQNPAAGLIDVNGTLYGTTRYGGAAGNGTVFALTP